ncbi:membrane metallo-endopeptidase-like 1 [Hemiscyllium ocellatum]|uniref:membrane metallo-endopeptidase-like 1 n=1 Tax=Hemiscyllium ocellatum TaxID=170820 RepID=UPI00296711EE|nr:membrane metallo-endopeptidase-like 1 [Hemiscyllium ocellatum]
MGKTESQMDIVEKSTKSAKKSWNFVEITLTVLLLIMTCAVVALVVLYTSHRGKQFSSNLDNVCMTSDCVAAAARIIQNMDSSVSPCEDFYRYACGGWLNQHIIPETKPEYSTIDILRDKLNIILKGVLEMPDDGDREAFKKAKQLYKSCTNESSLEERDSEPLLNLLDEIGGWPVTTSDWDITKEPDWSLETILPHLNTYYNKKSIVGMFVLIDGKNSSRHIIHVDEPTLGMPSRDYYFGNGNYKKVREIHLQIMITIAKMIREDRNVTKNDTFVEEEMTKVLEFETELANATACSEESRDVMQCYNRMTLPELQMKFDLNGFNWTQFLQGILASVDIEVHPEEEIVVTDTDYLQKLKRILPKYSKSTLQNYLAWQLILDHVNNLSRRFKDVHANYQKALFGVSREEARWQECTRNINSLMKNAVGALYVREAFAGKSKRMVKDLIDKIQEVFIETLDELEWMDGPSKQKAQGKVLAIREKIGYPDYILEDDNPRLDEEYKHLNFSKNKYFENVLASLKANAQKNLRKLREQVSQDTWILGVAVINAFYSPNQNQIVFPAGILQPPIFSPHQLQVLNFGGIGTVIGHEIIHGFDDNGRKYDKDGNLYDWWSNFSTVHFNDRSRCLVHQYGNYMWDLAGGQNVSGINTLGENIADNGGVRQAYKAYLKWVKNEGEEMKLPGLDLTHKQIFFLNFAQMWCGSYRPVSAMLHITHDVHSPLKFRVIGTLQNFEAFAEAFQCETGNVMHPAEKCRVW